MTGGLPSTQSEAVLIERVAEGLRGVPLAERKTLSTRAIARIAVAAVLEGCRSGRTDPTANRVPGDSRAEGSNPSPSVPLPCDFCGRTGHPVAPGGDGVCPECGL